MYNWEIYIQAFLLGAFPWISQLKKLNIHFQIPDTELKGIYNFFASILAISIFLYIGGTLPKTILVNLLDWFWFIGIAGISSFFYFIVYIYKRDQVQKGTIKWPIILNFVFYMIIFSSLTTGFGILKIYTNNYVIVGKIINIINSEPVEKAKLTITDIRNNVIAADYSNKKGQFLILIDHKKFKDCKFMKVETDRYEYIRQTIVDIGLIEEDMSLIKLKPNW